MLATYPDTFREYAANAAESDPKRCPCRGGGWILTPWDVWERCRRHYNRQDHPEFAGWEENDENKD